MHTYMYTQTICTCVYTHRLIDKMTEKWILSLLEKYGISKNDLGSYEFPTLEEIRRHLEGC